MSHSFFCCSFEVIALILLQTWPELNRIGSGCAEGWLPAIISFMFLIVACSSHPFLLTPLSFVCLTLLLSIWPAIDKTQSLTILGVLHRIRGDGALCIVASVCLFRLQERDGMQLTSLFIYLQLPDGAHKKDCVSRHTHTLCLSHSLFPTPHPFQHISHGSFQHMDRVFGPECAAWGDGEAGETARKAEWDLRGSCGKSGGSLSVALCVFSVLICLNRLRALWMVFPTLRYVSPFVNLNHKAHQHI